MPPEYGFWMHDNYELWVIPEKRTARVMKSVHVPTWEWRFKPVGPVTLTLEQWHILGTLYRERRRDLRGHPEFMYVFCAALSRK